MMLDHASIMGNFTTVSGESLSTRQYKGMANSELCPENWVSPDPPIYYWLVGQGHPSEKYESIGMIIGMIIATQY